MAGLKRRASQVWPEERVEQEHGLYSLHRMFDIVGTHLTHRDVRVLSFLFVDVIDDHEQGLIRNGRDFLLALEHQGRCDESNFRQVLPSCASSLAMTCCPRLLSRKDGLCAQVLFWAEYCQHETALQGNVFSNKQDPLERQFQRFNQANTILKSRDLGSIICDIHLPQRVLARLH